MARFILLAGKEYFGRQKDGTRKVVKAGEEFETISEKHAEFCRKYKDRYQEITGPMFARPMTNTLPAPVKRNPEKEVPTEVEEIEVDLDKIEKMDLRELLVFCRKAGIDVKGSVRRDDIIKAIKAEVGVR